MNKIIKITLTLAMILFLSVSFSLFGCKAAEGETEAVDTGETEAVDTEEAVEEVAEEEAVEAPEEEVTINFYNSETQETEIFDQIISLFEEKYPNITVELTMISFAEYFTALKARLLGGDVDLYVASGGAVQDQAVQDGYTIDFTGMPILDNFNMDAGSLDSVTYDGKVRALVYSKDIQILIYNKDMFDEYGIDYPSSVVIEYDELLNISDQFNQVGIPPMTMGIASIWPSAMLGYTITHQMTHPENIYTALEKGEEKLTGDRFRKIAEELDMWSNSGIIDPQEAGVTYDGAIAAFMQGKVPILSGGNWNFARFVKEENMNIGCFIAVTKNAKAPVFQTAASNGFNVNPKSSEAKQKAAIKFLEFLSTPEIATMYQDYTLRTSQNIGVTSDYPIMNNVFEIIESGNPETVCEKFGLTILGMESTIDEMNVLLFSPGDKDIDKILEEKQAVIDDIIAE